MMMTAPISILGSARAQRFPLNFPLLFRRKGELEWLDGETVNISRTGILFRTNATLQLDSKVDILVHLPTSVVLSCRGPIVREEGESLFAVHFDRHNLIRRN
jgi:hypothetical protein